ncbi:class F sortase [Streptomyces sp. K1PA1]|uniref:Class F sortase n=1 Tax=Streptomyces tropicalis TaxID=3034234 RepID=A0ABT6A2G6_9ACTN|nr:class F sortase [Streptomyces tropicalis]MDF3298845.1 class F sortase [Streptomyces tropicalis]
MGLGALLIHQSLGLPAESIGRPTHTTRTHQIQSAPAPVISAQPDHDDKALKRSAPMRLSIPSIGVSAPFTKIGLAASGQLEAPPLDDTNLVGWFKGGASPGERGSAIVVGHVDTKTGPAVFANLYKLEAGDTIDITREDGSVAHFKIDSSDTFSKADFPDEEVYSDTPTPELRLITCGGTFNRTTKDYEANLVVFAHLVARPGD